LQALVEDRCSFWVVMMDRCSDECTQENSQASLQSACDHRRSKTTNTAVCGIKHCNLVLKESKFFPGRCCLATNNSFAWAVWNFSENSGQASLWLTGKIFSLSCRRHLQIHPFTNWWRQTNNIRYISSLPGMVSHPHF
jgi:hypothetical protein